MDHKAVIKEIASDNRKPVYFLHGEEPYFIDLIEHFASAHLIDVSAREFDQTTLYGKDTDLLSVINAAKRFPMMGGLQLIVVREAQNIKKWDELISYLKHPQPQSLLIFAHKGKKLDARTLKKLEGAGIFESKRLYDNQIPAHIKTIVESKQLKIDDKNATLIAEFLGNDLSKISNEVEKLCITLAPSSEITTEIIEKNIGVSKEYNAFELNSALARRDILKANQIVNHFAANPKNYPIVVTIGNLYRFFNSVLLAHFLQQKDAKNLQGKLRLNYFQAKDAELGLKNYSKRKLAEIMELLNTFDLKSKGYGNTSTTEGELLKELVFKILH